MCVPLIAQKRLMHIIIMLNRYLFIGASIIYFVALQSTVITGFVHPYVALSFVRCMRTIWGVGGGYDSFCCWDELVRWVIISPLIVVIHSHLVRYTHFDTNEWSSHAASVITCTRFNCETITHWPVFHVHILSLSNRNFTYNLIDIMTWSRN